jgi:hypothetical protein
MPGHGLLVSPWVVSVLTLMTMARVYQPGRLDQGHIRSDTMIANRHAYDADLGHVRSDTLVENRQAGDADLGHDRAGQIAIRREVFPLFFPHIFALAHRIILHQ